MSEDDQVISRSTAKILMLNAVIKEQKKDIARLRAVIAGLHFHHKIFVPDCYKCQESLVSENERLEASSTGTSGESEHE